MALDGAPEGGVNFSKPSNHTKGTRFTRGAPRSASHRRAAWASEKMKKTIHGARRRTGQGQRGSQPSTNSLSSPTARYLSDRTFAAARETLEHPPLPLDFRGLFRVTRRLGSQLLAERFRAAERALLSRSTNRSSSSTHDRMPSGSRRAAAWLRSRAGVFRRSSQGRGKGGPDGYDVRNGPLSTVTGPGAPVFDIDTRLPRVILHASVLTTAFGDSTCAPYITAQTSSTARSSHILGPILRCPGQTPFKKRDRPRLKMGAVPELKRGSVPIMGRVWPPLAAKLRGRDARYRFRRAALTSTCCCTRNAASCRGVATGGQYAGGMTSYPKKKNNPLRKKKPYSGAPHSSVRNRARAIDLIRVTARLAFLMVARDRRRAMAARGVAACDTGVGAWSS